MTVLLESANIDVFNPEPALQLCWEAKIRKLGGKVREKSRRKSFVRSDNMDVIEVDRSEVEDLEEEERHEDDFMTVLVRMRDSESESESGDE